MAPAQEWLIAGLGNPGPGYERTRHNFGQMVVEDLARSNGLTLKPHRSGALQCRTVLGASGIRLTLVVPTTYMNLSGRPVKALADYYGVPPERVVAVHDELDVPFGSVRLKQGGGEGGHNGLRDISRNLGTKEYLRIRMGIGRPPGRQPVEDFVLKPFSKAERDQVPLLLGRGQEALEMLVRQGLGPAQQHVHSTRG